MKNLFLLVAVMYILFGNIAFTVNAQDNRFFNPEELEQALASRTEVEMKISSNLFTKIFMFNKMISNGITTGEAIKIFSSKLYRVDDSNRVLIMLRFYSDQSNEVDNVKSSAINSGGSIHSEEIGHNGLLEIYLWMPVNMIDIICSNSDVAFIDVAMKSITNITTAGDWQLNASVVRTNMGVNGEGNKIGVMSDGAKNWWDANQAFELSPVNVLQVGDPEGNEGTAMLEIIYDLAPGAQLYFSGLGDYYGNLSMRAQRISELENYGCNIIVDDIWHPVEPFYSDETTLGLAIRDYINNGNVYVSAAGNDRERCFASTTLFSNNYHLFPSGNDYYQISVDDGSDIIILQWATSWSNPTQDLNLEIYNMNNQLLPGGDNCTIFYRTAFRDC